MELGYAIRTQSKAIARIRQIFRTARSMGYHRDWINTEYCNMLTKLPKNFAMSRIDSLRVVYGVLYEEMMERDIESVYQYNNETYSTHSNTQFHKKTTDINPKELHDNNTGFAFFWLTAGKQLTDWQCNGDTK